MDADPWDIVDDTEPLDAEIPPPAEEPTALDTRRIQRIATLHCAGRQSRKWAAVVVSFCAIGAVDLTFEGVRRLAAGDRRVAIPLCFTAIALATMGFVRFRATRPTLASPHSPTVDELPPPDFDPLGDGSQIWQDCEKIR